jgi:hypothetical protein
MKSLYYTLRDGLSTRPALFFPLQRLKGFRVDRQVTRTTEIVIEGYPRSANSYAVVAFKVAQGREMRIAHHLHASAQILRGIAYGIPTMLLIREPAAAIRSMHVARPDLSPDWLARSYIRFYDPLRRHRDDLVVAEFGQVTQAFDEVIDAANLRFGAQFRRVGNDPAMHTQIQRMLELEHERWNPHNPGIIPYPSAVKPRGEQIMIAPNLLAECKTIYRHFTAETADEGAR